MTLSDFGDTARKLPRNPLGIVALFIVLIYGLAAFVVGNPYSSLDPHQRTPLIWFLVMFPVLVLGVFAWLVTRHHGKLYSPADYRADDAFLQTLRPEHQRARLSEEVRAIQRAEAEAIPKEARPAGAVLSRISSRVVLAEELVFRKLEAEYSASIRRNVALPTSAGHLQVDGILQRGQEVIAIEVKYYTRPLARLDVIDKIMRQIELVQVRFPGPAAVLPSISLLLAAVTEMGADERLLLEQRLKEAVSRYPVRRPVTVRVFDFVELQREFGVDDEQPGR